jgi:hypothetical protein
LDLRDRFQVALSESTLEEVAATPRIHWISKRRAWRGAHRGGHSLNRLRESTAFPSYMTPDAAELTGLLIFVALCAAAIGIRGLVN